MSVVGGKLALAYLKDVVTRVEIHDLDGRLVREIAPPGIGSLSLPRGDPDDDRAFYSFESYTTPRETFETSIRTGDTRSFYRMKMPFDGTRYVVEQRFAISKDGTRVPVFVVRAKEADGGAPKKTEPLMLYGYGGYGDSLTPVFDLRVVPWLEAGGRYAVAAIRGGAEYGEAWHQAVVRRGKQRSFDDFAAAAEMLARDGYTSSDKLVIKGGSHGGLLVAASMTQRPELFRVVLCEMPLTDMIRFTRFGAGMLWREEIGFPDDEGDFRALLAYSPYHHVKAGTAYPSTLVLTGENDDRVDPMHARKLVAALQAASRGGPVLLSVERDAGHGGTGRKRDSVAYLADEYSFALSEIAGKGAGR
jgi:prolyl oligopeptidase